MDSLTDNGNMVVEGGWDDWREKRYTEIEEDESVESVAEGLAENEGEADDKGEVGHCCRHIEIENEQHAKQCQLTKEEEMRALLKE